MTRIRPVCSTTNRRPLPSPAPVTRTGLSRPLATWLSPRLTLLATKASAAGSAWTVGTRGTSGSGCAAAEPDVAWMPFAVAVGAPTSASTALATSAMRRAGRGRGRGWRVIATSAADPVDPGGPGDRRRGSWSHDRPDRGRRALPAAAARPASGSGRAVVDGPPRRRATRNRLLRWPRRAPLDARWRTGGAPRETVPTVRLPGSDGCGSGGAGGRAPGWPRGGRPRRPPVGCRLREAQRLGPRLGDVLRLRPPDLRRSRRRS